MVPKEEEEEKSKRFLVSCILLFTVRAESESEDELFVVECILDIRGTKKGKRMLLVRWKGYDSNEDSWIPESNLSLPLSEYDMCLKDEK